MRAPDTQSCIKYEQRSNVLVLALVALQSCLRIFENLKEDESRMLRMQFPNDLNPRQVGPVPGVLFGEAVIRNIGRAFQVVCLVEADRRIADFRRRSLAMTPASSCCASQTFLGATGVGNIRSRHGVEAASSKVSSSITVPMTPPAALPDFLLRLLPKGWRIRFPRCSGTSRGTKERAAMLGGTT